MTYGLELHDPDVNRLYEIDWNTWLGAASLASVTWSISPAGPTLSGGTHSGGVASVRVAGGTRGQVYDLTCRATTAAGDVEDRSITLRCGTK